MIHEFAKPIPCVTVLGDGFILYVTSMGYLENDEFTVILKVDGSVKHFGSHQVYIQYNATYGIEKSTPVKRLPEDSPELALMLQVEQRQQDLAKELRADLRY